MVESFFGCRSVTLVARGVSLPVCHYVCYGSARTCLCDDPRLYGIIVKILGAAKEFGRCGTMHFATADALLIARTMTDDFSSFGRVSHFCCSGRGVVLRDGSFGPSTLEGFAKKNLSLGTHKGFDFFPACRGGRIIPATAPPFFIFAP